MPLDVSLSHILDSRLTNDCSEQTLNLISLLFVSDLFQCLLKSPLAGSYMKWQSIAKVPEYLKNLIMTVAII